jgi:hypothetical protein
VCKIAQLRPRAPENRPQRRSGVIKQKIAGAG